MRRRERNWRLVSVMVCAVAAVVLAAPAFAAAKPKLSARSAFAFEGNQGKRQMRFEVDLSQAKFKPVTVRWAVAADAASPANPHPASSADFTADHGTLRIKSGDRSGQAVVDIQGDRLDEFLETVRLTLSHPRGARIAIAHANGFILDDDAPPVVQIGGAAVAEGGPGQSPTVGFPLTLSQPSGKPITATAQTAEFTATSPADFLATGPTTITFAPGETTKPFSVPIVGDDSFENNEAFAARIVGHSDDVSLGQASAAGTIQNDDAPPQLGVGDATVAEGNSGTKNMTFTVSLGPASGLPASVDYTTQDGTATAADDDYEPVSGTLNFAPGDTEKQVDVVINGDPKVEPNETFTLVLANAAGSTIATSPATGTIADDADSAQNETDSTAEADACSVSPQSFSVASGQLTPAITGDLTEEHVTDAVGPGTGVEAQLGFGAPGSDPRLVSWTWKDAAYFFDPTPASDRYVANFHAPADAGPYSYGYRFSLDGGTTYTYCDTDGAGSDPGLTFDPAADGVMTVTP